MSFETVFKAVRGMRDILPEDAPAWNFLEVSARSIFRTYGYGEIRTPIVEPAELFVRGVGVASDIVNKQMYVFEDRKGRNLALRPEGTASVVRAYLERSLHRQSSLTKLFYMGPFFRAERPQAGRSRQFHQIGAEAIGSTSAALDAEIISLSLTLLKVFGLPEAKIHLNSIGCVTCQPLYRGALLDFLDKKRDSLCSDCQYRAEKNPLRVLDCKKKACQTLLSRAPGPSDYLCSSCSGHFSLVREHLEALGLKYHLSPHLVRGLDYYTHTVFEITHPKLGAQDALAAGGRYNRLIEKLGGDAIPATGFALGLERVLLARAEGEICQDPEAVSLVYLAPQGEKSQRQAFKLLHQLREAGIASDMDYDQRSLKSQLRCANRLRVKYVVVIPAQGAVFIKEMQSGAQEEINIKQITSKLKKQLLKKTA